jgi:hypothetical protein
MKKYLYVLVVGVLVFLLTGCGGGGGGGGGVSQPTVRFTESMSTDNPGWPAASMTATDVDTTISNKVIEIDAAGKDSYGNPIEIDIAFTPDLSSQAATYQEAGYMLIAAKNLSVDSVILDCGSINISNIQISTNRVSGSFKFTTNVLYNSQTQTTTIWNYSITVEGTFDVPSGHWVYQNGQWQQIAKQK